MTESNKSTDQECRQHEAAVDKFMDLLARLIARDHLRREANREIDKSGNQEKKQD